MNSNSKVIRNWLRHYKAASHKLWTDGEGLYVYNDKIGHWYKGEPIVFSQYKPECEEFVKAARLAIAMTENLMEATTW